MLENHMVLPSAAPESKYEHIQPKREESCSICKQTGYLTDDGWSTEICVEHDETDFLASAGDDLTGAADTEWGWVCSDACRSQIMYEKAGEKKVLDAVLDACRVIDLYGNTAIEIVNKHTDGYAQESIVEAARTFLEAVGEFTKHADDRPAWLQRDTRKEELEYAMWQAGEKARRLAFSLGYDVWILTKRKPIDSIEAICNEWEVRKLATAAASAANIAVALKEAEGAA